MRTVWRCGFRPGRLLRSDAAAVPWRRLGRAAVPAGVSALALLVLAVLSGCSRYALQSTPFWDLAAPADTSSAQDRVNLWPLLYWRAPALSVLWPLITTTDQGHAVAPLYEYYRPDRRLRLLAVHPAVPAAIDWRAASGRYRVLNTVWNARRRTLAVAPIYHQEFGPDGRLLVLPVWYHDRHGFWNPLLTWRDDLKGVAGPLVCRAGRAGRYRYYAPWPLVAWWDLPEDRQMRLWPLLDWRSGAGRRRLRLGIAPMYDDGTGTGSATGIVLGGWSADGQARTHWLMPLWYAHREAGGHSFLSLPYVHTQSSGGPFTSVLLNGYVDIRTDSLSYQSLVWPVAHRWRSQTSTGHAVLPLYFTRRLANGGRSFYSLPVSWSSDRAMRNVGVVLFHRRTTLGGHYTTVAWPLAHFWRNPRGASGSAILPLYFHQRSPNGTRVTLTPLAGLVADPRHRIFLSLPLSFGHQDDGASFVNVGLFLFNRWSSPERTRTDLLWPLASWQRGPGHDRVQWRALPLASYQRDARHTRFWSLPVSTSRSRISPEALRDTLLSRNQAQRRRLLEVQPGGLPPSSRVNQPVRCAVELSRLDVLLGLAGSRREASASSAYAPLNGSAARTSTLGTGVVSAAASDTVLLAPPAGGQGPLVLAYGRRSTDWILPLYWRQADAGATRANLLWRLYDYRRDADAGGRGAYRRHRVLWRLFHRESYGGYSSTDMFPFLAWDRDRTRGRSRFSFAAGLIEYRRDADGAHLGLVAPLIRNIARIFSKPGGRPAARPATASS